MDPVEKAVREDIAAFLRQEYEFRADGDLMVEAEEADTEGRTPTQLLIAVDEIARKIIAQVQNPEA